MYPWSVVPGFRRQAGFLDFCEDFFVANCANDANGPHRIVHIAVIAGGPFASFAQFAAQILV
ncbi:MAG: hypothetical protein DMG12_01910 [Acidobacteria bacterium]|nr:MAG: hypothetical protein DMG12_01910 [Acidobacteriota bacterium]